MVLSVAIRAAVDVRVDFGLAGGFRVTRPLGVERLEDPGPETLLELEQDADTGEVHASLTGEMTDPQDPPDVVLAVQADVGRRPRRAEQTLVLVDPQRARMCADDARRDADHVNGTSGVSLWPWGRHRSGSLEGVDAGPGSAVPTRLGVHDWMLEP